MLVYIYSICTTTSIGFEILIRQQYFHAKIKTFKNLPSSKQLNGAQPDLVFIKTFGFLQKDLQNLNLHTFFPSARFVWIKSPFEDYDQYDERFSDVLDVSTRPKDLMDVLAKVLEVEPVKVGLSHFSEDLVKAFFTHQHLPEKEAMVFSLLAQKKTYKEISNELNISIRSAEYVGEKLIRLFELEKKSDFVVLWSKFQMAREFEQ